jgi:hypothetical protein
MNDPNTVYVDGDGNQVDPETVYASGENEVSETAQ